MPRPPRIAPAGISLHVVQRGNDRQRTFYSEEDYRTYLLLLARISSRYATSVHAYVLMGNHVHLLLTSTRNHGVSATMQQVGSSYSRYINKQYQRTGTLWEGRFRSSAVDSDHYCLACYRYIELNPVRAGLVDRPQDYAWSSHRENTGRRALTICSPHPSFDAIAPTPASRIARYQAMFQTDLPESAVTKFRNCVNSGSPTGNDAFCRELQRKVAKKGL